MDYATIAELLSRVGETRANDLSMLSVGAERTAYFTALINQAEGIINGYAKKLFTVPIPASYVAKEWTLTIATMELYKKGLDNDVPIKFKYNYEEAMKQIVDMNTGDFIPPDSVDGEDEAVRAGTAGDSISLTSNDSVFDEDNMEVF